ncbi:hypothetical protein BJ165DRAFT_1534119 [Panaeolus papilionaceus]|nr:hypothetical protein BJ165DRAFT_1534119 [Panaeolus papilionaceus]
MSTSYLEQMGMPTLNLPIIASPGGHYVYLIVDLFQRIYRVNPNSPATMRSHFLKTLQQIVDHFAEIDEMVIQEEFQHPYRDEDLQELRNQISSLTTDLCSQYPRSWMHGKITQAFDDYFDQDIFMIEHEDEEQTEEDDTSDTRSECSDTASVSSEASTFVGYRGHEREL